MKAPAVIAAGLVACSLALAPAGLQAQEKKTEKKAEVAPKVLHEDDKVRVTEIRYKPGDTGPMVTRGFRVTRALRGGTVERTYADGRKEKVEWKTGEVRTRGPDKEAYRVTNVGKSEIHLYTVTVKQAK